MAKAGYLDNPMPSVFASPGVQLTTDITESACVVNADRMRLRQILDNLLSNAIKNDTAMILLQDTGIGHWSNNKYRHPPTSQDARCVIEVSSNLPSESHL